ncbi:rwd domain-containing protein, partial [Spiromyces aspiralis]
QAEIEKERQKYIGTPVTLETFTTWKQKFDEEMAQKSATADGKGLVKKSAHADKPTGRQLFEQDKSLAKSDDKYMNVDDVAIDASLIENELEDISSSEDEDDNSSRKVNGLE